MTENAFGDDWHKKYVILDDSMRYVVNGLKSIKKEIGEALILLVDTKFTFRQPLHYFEPDGSA